MSAKVSLAGRSTAPSRRWPSPSLGAQTAPGSAASAVARHGPLGRRTERAPVTGYIFRPGGIARAFGTMNQFTFDLGSSSSEQGFTMACGERPQARLENFGVSAVSDVELLAMVLQGNGTSPDVAVKMASRLISQSGSIAGLSSWVASDYRKIKGIGQIKGLQLVAIAEISRRMMAGQREHLPILSQAEHIAEYFTPIVSGLEVEKFWVLCLNRKNRLLKRVEVTSGTATNSLVHPREVFREAIREGASAIVCVHNHPSGDPTPSAADIQVTRVLREAAKTVCIDLLDHVIVGNVANDPSAHGLYSFRRAGLI